MKSIIIAFAILLGYLYEMNRQRFQTIFPLTLLALISLGTLFASRPSGVLAQQPTETPASQSGVFITVLYDEPQINVRLGPSSTIYPVVGTMVSGQTAPALGRSQGGDWIQIEFPSAPNYFGIWIPKDAPAEVIAAFGKAWDEVIKNSQAVKDYAAQRGALFDPSWGDEAKKKVMPYLSIIAWNLQDAGQAKVSPDTVGIPKP